MSDNTNANSVFNNRRTNRPKPRQSHRTGLSYCHLEDRKLLAAGVATPGVIATDPTSMVMLIRGSDAIDDQVFVSTVNEDEVRVLFNGEFCVFPRTLVEVIRFEGMGGDDVFNNGLSDIPVFAFGGEGNDRLIGGSSTDRLLGEDGDDVIVGRGGDDFLFGGIGQDSLLGSEGNDLLRGGDGADRLRGDSGTDRILGDAGNDIIAGGDGDDRLNGGVGNDFIYGQLGSDTINGNSGNDQLFGNEGDDILFGGTGDDGLFGQSGEDRINGFRGNNIISGGADDDSLRGGENDDVIRGDGGNDTILGLRGNDTIFGNEGNDFILGGDGEDSISGNEGDDTIGGEAGNDTIISGTGQNLVFGGEGDDLIRGGNQIDFLFGQSGNDRIFGVAGSDRIEGNDGDDYLDGGFGNDVILGNSGNDRLIGGIGDDQLHGGDGADGLFGGVGRNDRLSGDAGSDRFLIADDDQIIDLESSDAKVIFRNGFSQWSDAEIVAIDDGLDRLQSATGNNRLAKDPLIERPIVFVKARTLPEGISLSQSFVAEVTTVEVDPLTGQPVETVERERRYVFADWDENDGAANELRALEVPRTLSIAWASTEAIGAVVPNSAQLFNRFSQLSAWRTTRSSSFFRLSEDNMFFYRRDALFADETGRFNPTQDWASAWELFFSPEREDEKVTLVSKLSILDQLFTSLKNI